LLFRFYQTTAHSKFVSQQFFKDIQAAIMIYLDRGCTAGLTSTAKRWVGLQAEINALQSAHSKSDNLTAPPLLHLIYSKVVISSSELQDIFGFLSRDLQLG
jgi:hypothetical protein